MSFYRWSGVLGGWVMWVCWGLLRCGGVGVAEWGRGVFLCLWEVEVEVAKVEVGGRGYFHFGAGMWKWKVDGEKRKRQKVEVETGCGKSGSFPFAGGASTSICMELSGRR